ETGEVMRRAQRTVRRMYREAANEKDSAARAALVDWAKKSESADRLRAMLKLAQSAEGIAVKPDAFDADPWALNVLNGTIDLRTGVRREHRRDDLITALAPVWHDPAARLALWDRFLGDVTGGNADLQTFLQRAAGATLAGVTPDEVLLFVHGPEASGKS